MNKKNDLIIGLVGLLFTLTGVVAAPTEGGMQATVNALQQQIQQVANSIPVQIAKAQAINQQQIQQLQQQMQMQLSTLQKEVQQLQDQTTLEVNTLQKEVHQLELVR